MLLNLVFVRLFVNTFALYRRGNLDGFRTALDAIDLTSLVQSNNDISTSWQH
jgi:hypothetical protein